MIKNNSKHIDILDIIKKSDYGIIYKCYDHKKNKICVKKFRFIKEKTLGIPQNIIFETKIFTKLSKNPKNEKKNLLIPYEIILNTKKQEYEYIYDFYNYNLKEFYKKKNLDEKNIKKIIYQILKGLSILHKNKILHRSISPENILIDNNFNVFITDFSFAKEFCIPVKKLRVNVGELRYRSPQMLGYEKNIIIYQKKKNKEEISKEEENEEKNIKEEENEEKNIKEENIKEISKEENIKEISKEENKIEISKEENIKEKKKNSLKEKEERGEKEEKEYYLTGLDIWSVGCIAIELIIKEKLFISENEEDLLKEIIFLIEEKNILNVLESLISKEFIEFIFLLLEMNELKRIEAIQAIDDFFFDDIREEIEDNF